MTSRHISSIRLVAMGDISLNGRYDLLLKKHGPQYPCAELTGSWNEADLVIANLESPITRAPRVAPSKCTLRGSELAGECLRKCGVSVVSLANNHMMDYGKDGLIETIEHLDQCAIPCLGAGVNIGEAGKPLVVERRNQSIGFLSFCSVTQKSPLYATEFEAGVNPFDETKCIESIRRLRRDVDWLIVNLHWGTEMALIPSPEQRDHAKAIVDAGADVIFGHHPHVMQPMELIGNSVVFYSLGNFLFSDMYWRGVSPTGEAFVSRLRLHPLSRLTCWVEVELARGKQASARIHPARLGNDLAVSPDCRRYRLSLLKRQLSRMANCEYSYDFQRETIAAQKRSEWRWAWRPIHRRIEMRLFYYGWLRNAVEGT